MNKGCTVLLVYLLHLTDQKVHAAVDKTWKNYDRNLWGVGEDSPYSNWWKRLESGTCVSNRLFQESLRCPLYTKQWRHNSSSVWWCYQVRLWYPHKRLVMFEHWFVADKIRISPRVFRHNMFSRFTELTCSVLSTTRSFKMNIWVLELCSFFYNCKLYIKWTSN